MTAIPRVLSIAGTDPSGGAGVQADLKSIAANGGYGMSVVTALVAQNTQGVRSVHIPPTAFFREQLDAVGDDVAIDGIKIGMLANAPLIAELSDWLAVRARGTRETGPVVLDPVMVSTSGHRLLDDDAVTALVALLERVTLVTPNLPELAILLGETPAKDWPHALEQAQRLAVRHHVAVLVKGGHLDGSRSPDALITIGDGRDQLALTGVLAAVSGAAQSPTAPAAVPLHVIEFDAERVRTRNTHGTGCSLSSALATRLARGEDTEDAIRTVKRWLTHALERSEELQVGSGNGPINHFAGSVTSAAPADRLLSGAELAPPSAQWWLDIAPIRQQTDDGAFITQLADGTLAQAVFEEYLRQDAIYLHGYAQVLDEAARLADDEGEHAFWSRAATECRETELELHRGRLGHEVVQHDGTHVRTFTPESGAGSVSALVPGSVSEATASCAPVTRAYLDHLRSAAAGGEYAVLVAAVLPCFWMYRDIGHRLAAARSAGHPFDDWLASYGDPDFDASTARAIAITDRAVAAAPAQAAAARSAFYRSAALERDFFAAPLDLVPGADPGR